MVKSVAYCNREIPQKMKSEYENKRKNDDEKEIDEMAKAIARHNAHFKPTNNIALTLNTPTTPGSNTNISEDSCSTGRFGWEEINECHISIPFILRGENKFVSHRIVYFKVWNTFIPYFSPDVFQCIRLPSYNINESEAKLLDEINFIHCDSSFGKSRFTTNDKIISLQDFRDAFAFLKTSFFILILENTKNDKCGFIQIGGENLVPFVYVNGKKALPMFYFDGESDYLQSKSFSLAPFEMMYLRFCCKLQQIRRDHYDVETCKAVYLDDLSLLFSKTTKFVEHWPEIPNLNLLTPFGKQRHLQKLDCKTPKLKIILSPQPECILAEPASTAGSSIYDVQRFSWPLPKDWTNPYHQIVNLLEIDIPKDLNVPYKIFTPTLLDNFPLACINLFPYVQIPLLVSLKQIHSKYYLSTPMPRVKHCFELVGFTLYTLNNIQMNVFRGFSGDCNPGYFVQLDEFVENLASLNLMVSNTTNFRSQ